MAWSTPLTATASSALTAAQWNASVRDNLLETPAAKATTAGSHFVGTGPNGIAERITTDAAVTTAQTTSSTAYTSLATDGPTITAATGARALVWINCQGTISTTNSAVAAYEITGATTAAASDTNAVIVDSGAGTSVRGSSCTLNNLTPGNNTFRMLYRVSGGTGTFERRRIVVMPL